ncbi:MAG: DNA repair protein, partial [Oscillospiraceae bacterium]|nr:DNA repair protein [Oscillospiraceae bacterium]
TARELGQRILDDIYETLGLRATCGIGSNLFLTKVALDITAKHSKDHMGFLNEELYRETLWDHRPITDFWQVAGGTQRRLERYGITTMRGVTEAPVELMYRVFGKDAELLIDHAWGRESCLMEDIKNYRCKSHSVSFSQILPRNYTFDEARVVMQEMVLHGSHELMRRKVITQKVWIGVGYAYDTISSSKGSTRLVSATSVNSLLQGPVLALFDRVAVREVPIRRLAISFNDVCDEGCEGYDFFTDWEAVEREKAREKAVLELSGRYGKNAVLRGTNYLKGATQRERNGMIGGHRAGYDDARRKG